VKEGFASLFAHNHKGIRVGAGTRRPEMVGVGGGLVQQELTGTVTGMAQLASGPGALEKNLARCTVGRSNPGCTIAVGQDR
jgi:hypothetical protein